MLITETAEMEIDSEFYSLFCDEINSLARNPSVDKLRLFLAVTIINITSRQKEIQNTLNCLIIPSILFA
jgi:hypothetical protein